MRSLQYKKYSERTYKRQEQVEQLFRDCQSYSFALLKTSQHEIESTMRFKSKSWQVVLLNQYNNYTVRLQLYRFVFRLRSPQKGRKQSLWSTMTRSRGRLMAHCLGDSGFKEFGGGERNELKSLQKKTQIEVL